MLGRFSLRQKVTALLLALSLGPLAVVGFVNQNRAVEGAKHAVAKLHVQAARTAADRFADLFGTIEANLAVLADQLASAEPLPVEGAPPGVATGADRDRVLWLLASLKQYRKLFRADVEGDIEFIAPDGAPAPGYGLDDLHWIARTGEFEGIAVATAPPLAVDQRPTVVVVEPLHRDGAVAGYLGAVINPDNIQEIVARALQAGTGGPGVEGVPMTGERAVLLTPDGRVIAFSGPRPEEAGPLPPVDALGRGAPREIEIGGERYLVARATFPGPVADELPADEWSVVLATPARVAYRDIYALTWMLTIVILLTFVFVLLLADHLTTVLLRPVQELERGSEMIGAGAFDYRIELASHRGDELGRLAVAFNEMGENLLRNRREIDAQRRNLEVANQELDAMVFAITHDLKKALRGIEAFATFLEEDYADRLDDEGLDLLHSIVGNVNRISKLADDLIGLVEHERERSASTRFDMGELLREARDRALERYPGEVVIPPGLPEVYADRQRLLLVFVNLISNGLKFNRSGRPRVEVQYADQGVFWEFRVIDNGIGIDPRYHQQIFELFSRLNQQGQYEGSGTGLNLARRIIEEHRGTLVVDSTPGQGSTFIVTLPKDPALLTSPGMTPIPDDRSDSSEPGRQSRPS